MTEHEKPREWVLRSGRPAYALPSVIEGAELPQHQTAVRAVEAIPVEREREEMLDLLEECIRPGHRILPHTAIKALLRKHGRIL